jgi:hypothetical protein
MQILTELKKVELKKRSAGTVDIALLNIFPAQALVFSGKIKDRSRAIFGTGDNLRVITVTANSGHLFFLF